MACAGQISTIAELRRLLERVSRRCECPKGICTKQLKAGPLLNMSADVTPAPAP
jgi:hypothetical protein